MQVPLLFLDQTVLEEVRPSLWIRVFDAVGWPESLQSKRDSLRPPDVRHALERDSLSEELLLALEILHTLGTDAGRDAIAAAMADQRLPAEVLPANLGARELALELFLRQREDASLADVLVRAQTQAEERSDHRRYNEFLGKDARPVSGLRAKGELLQAELREYCLANDLGDHVHVHAFEDGGTYVFQVIRSHSTKKPRAVIPGQVGRTTIEYRPVHADILRYESAFGRLRIAARVPSVVEFYRRTLGRVLFSDEDFFSGDAVCNLRVLQQRGQAALDNHGIPLIGRVRMTECMWERGDQGALLIRSTDCFRTIEELGLSLTEGQLVQAKLKLQVIGASTRPLNVSIRASRIELSAKRHEKLTDQFLDAIGIRVRRREETPDLWSLRPWRHSVSVWRSVFGRDTDGLVESRVLIPVRLQSTSSPDHEGAGRILEAIPIESAGWYGVSLAPEIPPRSLSATDLDGLELQPERLREYLRAHLGLTSEAAPWDDSQELLDLGDLVLANARVRLTYALRQPSAGIGDRLRARAPGAHLVLLMPSPREGVSELPTAVLPSPFPEREQVIRAVVAACGLSSVAPALYRVRDGVRLIVDAQQQQIWVDGVLISSARPDTHAFRFIEAMVKAMPEAVSHAALTEVLSAARKDTDGTVTARQAKSRAVQYITEDLAKAGRQLDDDPFPRAGTGCYRCTLTSQVI